MMRDSAEKGTFDGTQKHAGEEMEKWVKTQEPTMQQNPPEEDKDDAPRHRGNGRPDKEGLWPGTQAGRNWKLKQARDQSELFCCVWKEFWRQNQEDIALSISRSIRSQPG